MILSSRDCSISPGSTFTLQTRWYLTVTTRSKLREQSIADDHVWGKLLASQTGFAKVDNSFPFPLLKFPLLREQVRVTEDTAKLGAADLASSLGGALGLWMGVSVLSVCEIIELVLTLSGRCNKRQQHAATRVHVLEADALANKLNTMQTEVDKFSNRIHKY